MGVGGSKRNYFRVKSREFELGRTVGKGAFGKVLCVRDCEDETKLYALKVLDKAEVLGRSKNTVLSIVQERKIMSNLQHPFVVNLWASSQDNKSLYMVLDLKTGGDLAYHIPPQGFKDEKTIQFYMANLLLGLQYIHSQKIVHRDIKPPNILLDERGYASLTDFNIASNLHEKDYCSSFCGTPLYQAPETYRKEKYAYQVDYWSLGIMMYEMMFGRVPWVTNSGQDLRKDIPTIDFEPPSHLDNSDKALSKFILTEKLPPLPDHEFSPACISFLNFLCAPVKKRLKNIQQAVEHDFFAKFNWDEMRNQKLEAPIKPRTDQANISVEVAMDDAVFDLDGAAAPVSPRGKLNSPNAAAFTTWDWLCEDWECEELEKEMKMQEEMAERKEKGKKSVGKGRKSPRPGKDSPLRKKNSKEKIDSSPREKEKGKDSPLRKSSGV